MENLKSGVLTYVGENVSWGGGVVGEGERKKYKVVDAQLTSRKALDHYSLPKILF